MSTVKNILIVGSDSVHQSLVCMIFRRSQMSFIPAFVNSLDAACTMIAKEKFDIVTLDGDFINNVESNIVDYVRKSISKNAHIIVFSDNNDHVNAGILSGANCEFNKKILEQPLKISRDLQLIPAKVKSTL